MGGGIGGQDEVPVYTSGKRLTCHSTSQKYVG